MANGAIWRFTNNGTAANGGAVDDLPANQEIDIPAEQVSIRWVSFGGNRIDRIYVHNQSVRIKNTGTGAVTDFLGISNSGANNLARARLIENHGFGAVLFDQSAS